MSRASLKRDETINRIVSNFLSLTRASQDDLDGIEDYARNRLRRIDNITNYRQNSSVKLGINGVSNNPTYLSIIRLVYGVSNT